MADLATIPFERSLPNDWQLSADARLKLSEVKLASATLIKAGRRVEPEQLALPLPPPNRWTARQNQRWLWQGPKEWLVLSDVIDAMDQTPHGLKERSDALVLDVKDRTLVLRISGSLAMQLLAKASSIDAALLTAGACCRTRFANLQATVLRLEGNDGFDLILDRSYSVYLLAWLSRATRDLGVA